MSAIQPANNLYGFPQPLSSVFRPPIVSKRTPAINDFAPIGTLWIDVPGQTAYVLVSIVSNIATWEIMTPAGGAGVFSSLVVNPGPITLTGTTTINGAGAANTTIGAGANTGIVVIGNTGNTSTSIFGAGVTIDVPAGGDVSISPSATTGQVHIGGALQTGLIEMGISTAAQTLSFSSQVNTGAQLFNVFNGNSAANQTYNLFNGVPSAGSQVVNIVGANNTRAAQLNIATGNAGHSVNIGNANAAANITLTAGSAAGVVINSTGLLAVKQASNTITSPATSVVMNKNFGSVQAIGFTTAASATQTLTITNALVSAASGLIVSVDNFGANDAQMTVTRVVKGVGTFDVTVTNLGTQALNGDMDISFIVMLP